MPTAGEALRQAAAALRTAGFRTPRLDAEVLLGQVTGFSRETLLAHPERILAAEQAASFETLVGRRLERCPVAYLVGHKEFMSLDFEVGPGVLIPRPETELLVEVALDLARQVAAPVLADVGTGSGAVAVSLAHFLPGAVVYATDLSQEALGYAHRNAERLKGRVELRRGDLLDALAGDRPEGGGPFLDGVIANLPYVPDRDWERLEPNVREWEPPESLKGGADGLDLVEGLIRQLPGYLRPGGFVCLEHGPGQSEPIAAALRAVTGGSITVHRDLAGLERVVAATNARPAGQPRG